MKPAEIAIYRLQNQHINHPGFSTVKEMAAWLGAAQAQDYNHAKWAFGLRLPGTTDADIEQAIDRADIIRTHLLRPTWHFVAAEDARWMLALSAPQIFAACAAAFQAFGLNGALFARVFPVFERALEGGRHLTRAALVAEVKNAGIDLNQEGVNLLMMRAELEGLVCNGVRQGKQLTYALLDERVPKSKMLERPEAIAELARRYFSSHGPATVADFQWWSGLKVADARAGLEAAKPDLVCEILDNQAYWAPNDFKPRPVASPALYLLPAFDEFLVSYKDRSASLDPSRKVRAITINGIFKPVVTVDGQVKGIWRRAFNKNGVAFEKELFETFSEMEEAACEAALRRFEAFNAVDDKSE